VKWGMVCFRREGESPTRSGGKISKGVAYTGGREQSYAAFVIDVGVTLGLSVGLAWLLFPSRPRADTKK
jgi:hypothetical protein